MRCRDCQRQSFQSSFDASGKNLSRNCVVSGFSTRVGGPVRWAASSRTVSGRTYSERTSEVFGVAEVLDVIADAAAWEFRMVETGELELRTRSRTEVVFREVARVADSSTADVRTGSKPDPGGSSISDAATGVSEHSQPLCDA